MDPELILIHTNSQNFGAVKVGRFRTLVRKADQSKSKLLNKIREEVAKLNLPKQAFDALMNLIGNHSKPLYLCIFFANLAYSLRCERNQQVV